MTKASKEIRTILATVTGASVLVPGSVVAEVINFGDTKPFKDAPAWLLGELIWNDWSVPVVSIASLAGKCESEDASEKNRVLVIKSLSESTVTPYLGILISGVPRMKKVTVDSISKPVKIKGHPSVFREVSLGEEKALIPDLDELTQMIEQAVGDS